MPRSSPRNAPERSSGSSGCSTTPSIKLDSVVSDVLGAAARAMLEELIAGERDPAVLAELARTRMRPKIPELRLALEGGFSEPPALLLRPLLAHTAHLPAAIARLDAQVETQAAPFSAAIDLLVSIPGIGRRPAWGIVPAMGTALSRFPPPPH